MESSKKIVVALGLAFVIVSGGVSHNIQAMEPGCVSISFDTSEEIKSLHNMILQESPGVYFMREGFAGEGGPEGMPSLYMIQNNADEALPKLNSLIVNLESILERIKYIEGNDDPGLMSSVSVSEEYNATLSILTKLQMLVGLIEQSCPTTMSSTIMRRRK